MSPSVLNSIENFSQYFTSKEDKDNFIRLSSVVAQKATAVLLTELQNKIVQMPVFKVYGDIDYSTLGDEEVVTDVEIVEIQGISRDEVLKLIREQE